MLSHAIPRSAAQRRMLIAALVLIAATPALASAMPTDAQAQARALLAGPALAVYGASLPRAPGADAASEPQEQARRLLAGPRLAPARAAAAMPADASAANPARRLILGKDA